MELDNSQIIRDSSMIRLGLTSGALELQEELLLSKLAKECVLKRLLMTKELLTEKDMYAQDGKMPSVVTTMA